MTSYPDHLRALKMAAEEAWTSYASHDLSKVPQDTDKAICWDLTCRRLFKAYTFAKAAYDKAADDYLSAFGGSIK